MYSDQDISKQKINVMLVGATGVGKSLLVNAIYGEDVVKSGDGEPITQFIQKIEIPSKGLVLWDTKGIESKDYENTLKTISQDIANKFWYSNIYDGSDEPPHVLWLCLKESSKRVEKRENDLINIAKNFGIPTVIVFTNMQHENGIDFFKSTKKVLDREHASFIKDRYIRVNSASFMFNNMTIPAVGLEKLLDLTKSCFEEGKHNVARRFYEVKLLRTLLEVQRVKLEMQRIKEAEYAEDVEYVECVVSEYDKWKDAFPVGIFKKRRFWWLLP